MSADRELLELAAKAAGMEGYEYTDGYTNAFYAGSRFYMTQPDMHTPWNPLDDDGDALRLAVRLGLSITQLAMEVIVDDRSGAVAVIEPNDDKQAATRRAIVRAAAEIGRSM